MKIKKIILTIEPVRGKSLVFAVNRLTVSKDQFDAYGAMVNSVLPLLKKPNSNYSIARAVAASAISARKTSRK